MEGSMSIFEMLLNFIGSFFTGFYGLLGNLFFLPIIISAFFFCVFLIRSVANYVK